MIFPQYIGTFEVLLDYPKMGQENIKYFAKKSIRNIFHSNIDVHIIILIGDISGYGVKFIEKLQ